MNLDQNFKEVNIVDYVKKGLIEESLIPHLVAKADKLRVIARHGDLGEEVTTSTSNHFRELKSKVKKNDKGVLEWVVVNIFGQKYIIDDDAFKERYIRSNEGKNIYEPKYYPVVALQVNENISFKTKKGDKMNLKEKGFIIIDVNATILDISCIQNNEFFATYRLLRDTEDNNAQNLIKKLTNHHNA